jgi:hypothetical protein
MLHRNTQRPASTRSRCKRSSRSHRVSRPIILSKYKSQALPSSKILLPSVPQPTVYISAIQTETLNKAVRAFYEASHRRSLRKSELVTVETCSSVATSDTAQKNPLIYLPTEDPDDTTEHFCKCKEPYRNGELMFKCEGFCGDWYHPKCVNMSSLEIERQSQSAERWYCPTCRYKASEVMLSCGSFHSKKF